MCVQLKNERKTFPLRCLYLTVLQLLLLLLLLDRALVSYFVSIRREVFLKLEIKNYIQLLNNININTQMLE